MKTSFLVALFIVPGWLLAAQSPPASDPSALLRARAYQLSDQGQLEEAVAQFQFYLSQHPEDIPSTVDLASLLSRLKRHQDAALLLEKIHREHPQHETAYFRLGLEYFALERHSDAAAVFTALAQSTNPAVAAAAAQSLRELRALTESEARLRAESRVFSLARDSKHAEVLEAIQAIQTRWGLTFTLEMQRLYSLYDLGRYDRAQQRADALAQTHPDSPELGFIRAELFIKQNRPQEAIALWEQMARTHVGTSVETEAKRRLAAHAQPPPPPPPPPNEEDRIYALARAGRHGEVLQAIDQLELRASPLSRGMQLQRLYALQSLGQTKRALDLADEMNASLAPAPDLVLLRADLLLQNGRIEEASSALSGLVRDYPDDPAAPKARARLEQLPPILNLEKDYWGEAYFSGDYLGRYGDLVGSGLARHGIFVPGARWLQPYVEFRFSVDTDSGDGNKQTIVTDNFVGFYGGLRAQVLPTEYLFVYAQAGTDQDLLDNRDDGDWAYDYQAGAYGFKSWGPGVIFHGSAPYDQRFQFTRTGRDSEIRLDVVSTNGFFWRNDWFVDVGADFSYYHRYSSWLGYGQAHQGLRVFQIGPTLALDSYLVEYLSWDVKGNYFDNFTSFGPGVRWVWQPCRSAQIVLRGEYVFGYYMGRDGEDNRGGASSDFNGVQVGLSVGLRW